MLTSCPVEIVRYIVSLSGFEEHRNLRSTCRVLRSLVGEDIAWREKDAFYQRGRRLRFFWGPHREHLLLRIVCEGWEDVLRVFLDSAPESPDEWDAEDRSRFAPRVSRQHGSVIADSLGHLSDIVNGEIGRHDWLMDEVLNQSLERRRMLAEGTDDVSIANFCREAEMLDNWSVMVVSRHATARWSLPGTGWEIVYRGGRKGQPPHRLILRRRTRQKRKREGV